MELVCNKCGSCDVSVRELWKDHSIEFSKVNGVFDFDNGNMEVGNPYKVEGFCITCKNQWSIGTLSCIGEFIEKHTETTLEQLKQTK
jgi:hypothetical protein